jgi:hypothetical protein
VAAVHGEDEVEAVEVGAPHLARDAGDVDAVPRAHLDGARVRPVARVEVVGARGVDLEGACEAGRPREVDEDRLGQGRAADVARADEEEAHAGRIVPARALQDSARSAV